MGVCANVVLLLLLFAVVVVVKGAQKPWVNLRNLTWCDPECAGYSDSFCLVLRVNHSQTLCMCSLTNGKVTECSKTHRQKSELDLQTILQAAAPFENETMMTMTADDHQGFYSFFLI
jgi:hypothetical protein